MRKHLGLVLASMFALSAIATAATSAVNANTVSPTLSVSATIQKAVSLTLATGATAGVSHCAVTATGSSPDFTMNFGTVDALGVNAGNCNKFNPATPGVSNAVYWSDYTLTPMFTSQSSTGASTVTAYVSTNFAGPNIAVVRSATANSSTVPVSAASFANMATSAPGDTVAASADITSSGVALTRFIGVSVAPTNGAGTLTGGTATVTFTLTVN